MNRRVLLLLPFFVCACSITSAGVSAQARRACQEIHFTVLTADKIQVRGTICEAGNDLAVVYGHRLLGRNDGEEIERLVEQFSDRFDLVTFKFRGHDTSLGQSTTGGDEILDLRAVIAYIRSRGYRKVVVLGAGMGGTVGIRTAAIFGNIDALVVISPSGFMPGLMPMPVKLLADIALDSAFGKIPLRLVTNTRLGQRFSAGYPLDLMTDREQVPTLIVHSAGDRLVSLDKLMAAAKGHFKPEHLWVVPGRRHAEDLIDPKVLREVRSFLIPLFGSPEAAAVPADSARPGIDPARLKITGDLPIPEAILLDELRAGLNRRGPGRDATAISAAQSAASLKDILSFHGYNRAEVSVVDSISEPCLKIRAPRIETVIIENNRWVSEDYLKRLLLIGRDYYNSYELDAGLRRVAAEPAVITVVSGIVERDDGDVDIVARIVERRPYRAILASKFTDVDKYFGVGITWNEYNPTGFRYEGNGLIGIEDYEFLNSHRLIKNMFNEHLCLSALYHDMVKSRDDLDYIFTRQEVRERGGQLAIGYRIISELTVQLELFGKKYFAPEVSFNHPVREGKAGGGGVKIDLSGNLPFQGPPRLNWSHTFYYQTTGIRGIGDFYFDTYQFNLAAEQRWGRRHLTRTTAHAGWISGSPPPQENLSLGGMHTFPGYPDDAFVNTRMVLFSHGLYLSARSLVNETSRLAPLRLILSFHAGTVWGGGEKVQFKDLKTDVVFEFDYMKMLRAGVAFPTGGLRTGSPRVYIGWGEHVF